MSDSLTPVSAFHKLDAGRCACLFESVVGGVRVKAPMLRIHTVAAGGGSLCRFDGNRFTVGPESAGADPGPLCYARRDATGAPRMARSVNRSRVDVSAGRRKARSAT